MQIKRGRPKKIKEEGAVVKAVHQEGSLGKNRLYKFKDGTSCLVMYSPDKSKPEEVQL